MLEHWGQGQPFHKEYFQIPKVEPLEVERYQIVSTRKCLCQSPLTNELHVKKP
jgi:hypothetical protein